tara:strand:+ start:38 stop:361 length:324 start_codon:yes stop_codon:yes gene_type:complete
MKYRAWDIGGEVVKQDDRYTVKDNTRLNNLIVSSTRLLAGKSTTGHQHAGQEEVYIFVEGQGEMELGIERFQVGKGDTVLIEDGQFHRVHAQEEMYFICVFDGRRSH